MVNPDAWQVSTGVTFGCMAASMLAEACGLPAVARLLLLPMFVSLGFSLGVLSGGKR